MRCTQSFKPFTAVFMLAAISFNVQANATPATIKATVDQTIQALMQQYQIPGMSVAITVNGRGMVLNYGVASKETRQPVSDQTLFEIGSISKTFAATLASLAQQQGKLAWTDSVSQHLPTLKGSHFDQVSLLNLATHTSGLPMQTPDSITSPTQLIDYLKAWTPPHAIGTHRIYSNNGIGLLGQIAAKSLQDPYELALQKQVLHPLNMTHTFITMPSSQKPQYAQGYTTEGLPIRIHSGMLSAEAYGLKTSSADMLKYLNASINARQNGSSLARAMANTQVPYIKAGEFTQDLIWEQYDYPEDAARLQRSSMSAIRQDLAITQIPQEPASHAPVLVHKTGSTNGFSAYIAYVPQLHIGVVLLANKSYPVTERVKAGYQILNRLEAQHH